MDIKFRLYPYPVLWESLDDYKSSRFDCRIDIERELRRFVLNVEFDIDNAHISKLIDEEKAEFVLHIESPATSYRLAKCTNQKNLKITLKDEHLLGKVSLCSFVVAKEDLEDYSNPDFNDDYKGFSFSIKKGAVLAIGSQFNFKVDKEKEDLSQVPSIFTIYKKETTEDMEMEIELCDSKIRIGLNIPDYENYNMIVRTMPEVVNSFIIFPALIYTFEQLKGNFDDFREYRWFQAIEKMFTKYQMVFNEDLFNSKSAIELAQKVMGLPISKSLKILNDLDDSNEEV